MLNDKVLIFLGTAGALSAGGLRLVFAYLVGHRYVDCVVTTGANLYHDLHETLGRRHYLGHPNEDDEALKQARIDRVYDTYASEDEFVQNDRWIASFAGSLEHRAHSTREFLHRLGERLWEETRQDGFLTAAYRARVPIYCPAIADSSIGLGLAQARHRNVGAGEIDVIADIIELTNLVARSKRTGSVVLGGGTPKNFINQACVQAGHYHGGIEGHAYALQIVTDAPHFGGASGSSLDEAKSWGKVAADATQVTVRADATIALPLLVSGLASAAQKRLDARRHPRFDPNGPRLSVDGVALADRFEGAE